MKLEIACNSIQSCLNAESGGADRIELFENLSDGGCTPSYGMLKVVKEKIKLPIYAMIRPRGGNFVYTDTEFNIMMADIENCITLGIDGIVFGILKEDGSIDVNRCKELQKIWKYKSITFHRAFDRSNNLVKAAGNIIDMGFERILTSGGVANVVNGLPLIRQLIEALGQRIIIMPGAGVTSTNAKEIMLTTGASEIHATCKRELADGLTGIHNHQFNDKVILSDEEEIRKLKTSISSSTD